jgi:hypothetical protein
MAIRKSSPYKEHFNKIIGSLYETGIIYYWEGHTIRTFMSERLQIAIRQSTILDDQDGPTQLTVNHLQGAFVILSLGLALATVSIFAEMSYATLKRHH